MQVLAQVVPLRHIPVAQEEQSVLVPSLQAVQRASQFKQELLPVLPYYPVGHEFTHWFTLRK
jgi:hypothetical protein